MKKIGAILFAFVLIACYSRRVYNINTSKDVQYLPQKEYVAMGENVKLTNSEYYFGTYDVTGYTIAVTQAEIVRTETFFKDVNANADFLSTIHFEEENNQNIYLVTLAIEYNGAIPAEEKDAINLMEFKLVGRDYVIDPTLEFNTCENFNPALNGNFMFKVTSGTVFQVVLAYPIPTNFLTGIANTDLEKNPPAVITTRYPTECYLLTA